MNHEGYLVQLVPLPSFSRKVAGEPLPRPLGLASCLCRKRNLWCDLCKKLLVGSRWIAAVGCLMTELKELYIQSTSRDQSLLVLCTYHLQFRYVDHGNEIHSKNHSMHRSVAKA